jgi:hypothetical protein
MAQRRRRHPQPLNIHKEASPPSTTSQVLSSDELVAQLISTSATATEPLPLPEFDPDDYNPRWVEHLLDEEDDEEDLDEQ